MNEHLKEVIRRALWDVRRDILREFAKRNGIPRGRSKGDTIRNILERDILPQEYWGHVFTDSVREYMEQATS